jgi:tellurite resistance protein TerC
MQQLSFWIGFNVFILVMLVIDLGLLNKKEKEVGFKESLSWVAFWTILALLFNALIYYWHGPEKAFEFLTGYVIEWSLSVDNLFVFIVIFKFFKVPKIYEHPVLFWGIIGALLLRGAFIFLGIALFKLFWWTGFVFGGILVVTGIKMFFHNDEEQHLDKNILVRLCRKFFPVSNTYHGKHFFVKQSGKWIATPLFLVLLVVDFTDIVFAVDSIPAVLAITQDTFIVYTSNVFAILGLRSLYFAISGMMDLFRYLKFGLAVILTFVGVKMMGAYYFEIPTPLTLIVILSILAISILSSKVIKEKELPEK